MAESKAERARRRCLLASLAFWPVVLASLSCHADTLSKEAAPASMLSQDAATPVLPQKAAPAPVPSQEDTLNPALKFFVSIAPLGTFIVAASSATFAYAAIKAQRANTRQQIARNLFADYLKRSIEYPHYASPIISRLKEPKKMDLINIEYKSLEEFHKEHQEIEQYEWFVASLIFCLNEILSMKPNKKRESYWNAIAYRHLGYHKTYFVWRLKVAKDTSTYTPKDLDNIWFLQLGSEFQQLMKRLLAPHLDDWHPRPYPR
jgi:hypothetical protein